ncbi:MAG TPA: methyltransferase, TIGR04325 family [Gaiellaceae bacterium]|nr:methyltransferase, TIGR04325 family [Gaiellaceae bacterium]
MSERPPLAARVRLFVKMLTPPVVWQALKAAKDRLRPAPPPPEPEPEPAPAPVEPASPPEWEYVPEGWERRRDPSVKGWDVEAIAAANRAKWPAYLEALRGAAPLGVYHESVTSDAVDVYDHAAHNMLVTYAYVLALAAHGSDRVSVLDWGGGVGHYEVLSRAVLPPGVELDYHCKDVPALVAAGRELLPHATFHDDDSCLDGSYDLVLVSGSLQYSEDWPAQLRRLGAAASRYLYVTRLPVALRSESFVVLQRAYAYGYDTEYLGWVVSRDALLREAEEARLRLVREFLLQAWFSAAGAPEDPVEHRGFLFRPER